ncbi:MAG: glycine--tRNA ligase [Deltaproteobacteria bacterium]|nr:glycine--tRNA ligase [Deltaproteobacteria bacterium]
MDILQKVLSLCKRRGLVIQSAEIYGGAKSLYDFGHLGFLIKENIKEFWKQSLLFSDESIFFIDGSILLPFPVFKASGHIDCFTDPLVDCKECKIRFRPDKVEKELGELKCPSCGSKNISDPRLFNLMFRTTLGPVDQLEEILTFVLQNSSKSKEEILKDLQEQILKSSVFLRPETAQNIFCQFMNLTKSYPRKLPFGIAQIGRAFRNEITTEKFLFRVAEFEQMELEFFVKSQDENFYFDYWLDKRLTWWKKIINSDSNLRIREYSQNELAHYAKRCCDIEFKFPWGFDEVEGVASRSDYDLLAHARASGKDFFVLEPSEKGEGQVKIVPWVIEPSCGLTRAFLAVILDAYSEEPGVDAEGQEKVRTVMKLKPFLAPYKAAVFPLVKNEELIKLSKLIHDELKRRRLYSCVEENQSIGKRYAKHDEIGTPFCITVDFNSLKDESVTVRDRDSTEQVRCHWKEAVNNVVSLCQMPA